jgi:AAHS family 4-hydroxybenzoate transporter-like MFS transporter
MAQCVLYRWNRAHNAKSDFGFRAARIDWLSGAEAEWIRRRFGHRRQAQARHIFDRGARFILREEKRSGVLARHLFTEGRAATTLLLWFAYVFSLTGQYFLTSWLPTVLVGSGLSLGNAVETGSAVQIGGAFGGLILCWLIDKRGIWALVASFAVVAPLIVLVPWATVSNILLMPLAFLIGFCLMGGLTGLNGISGTFYPTYIRSTGVGWALGVGRIGSILGPVLGGILISFNPRNSVLFTCAAVPVLCCAGALYLFAKLPVNSHARQASAVPQTNPG